MLNSRAGIGLLAAAAVLWLGGLHVGVALVVGLSGLVVVAGHLGRGVAKLSLHVAFAVFAAGLAWPDLAAMAALTATALAVGWSRLALRRHTAVDVALGALAGTSAGLAFHVLIRWLAAA